MSFIKFLFSKTFLIQVVLAIIALVLIGFITVEWLEYSTNHKQRIEVPLLSKLKLDQVDTRLEAMDLRREILDSANYNPEYPPYTVIEQTPRAGKYVKENRKIYLTLNPSGYRKIEIPKNLIRHTRRNVEATLRSLGFEIGSVTYKPDVAKDAVLELRYKGEELEAGTKLMKTSKIDLILGDGSKRYQMSDPEEESENESIDAL